MSQPVNLNQFRKAAGKSARKKSAQANVEKFGQKKSDQTRQKLLSDIQARRLDGKKIEPK